MVFLSAFHTYGQTKGFSAGDNESLLKSDALEGLKASQQAMNSNAMAVDNIVSPQQYRIGPGDILSYQLLNSAGVEQLLQVTPENSVLLPRIGEVSLIGKTLAEAKDTIIQIVKQRNANTPVYITLRQPRLAIVNVRGNVLFPNTYTLPASMKVSTAIKLANQLQGSSGQANFEEVRAMRKMQAFSNQYDEAAGIGSTGRSLPYAMRNTIVKHNDGTTKIIDIERALAMGDAAYDIHLREGDEIYVPFEPRSYPTISISGGVRRPGVYAFKNGDKASLLLKFGLGISETGDPSRVYLTMPGRERRLLAVDNALNLVGNDIALEPGSAIIVEENSFHSNVKQGVVTVSGAVQNPGTFVIEPHVTRMKDVISRAGGFKEDAYLPLAYILRRESNQTLQIDERFALFEKFQYSNLTLEDTVRYLMDMNYRRPIVSADFVAAYQNNSDKDNVPLEDGDVIVIPTNPKRVYIFGQVNKPGYIEFTPGRSMTWYIEQAGGYATGAEPERARIIRGRTNVWEEDAPGVVVNAGDEIYIPRPPDISKSLELQNKGITASLISTAVFATLSLVGIIVNLIIANNRK